MMDMYVLRAVVFQVMFLFWVCYRASTNPLSRNFPSTESVTSVISF